jgi:hypothetical protein
MPDTFDSAGLQTKTLTEIVDELATEMKDIYGDDINLDQNSPDGQHLNIFGQSGVDMREILAAAIASLDPDQAEGRTLDLRVALNGIERRSGTFTMVNINITTDRAVTLKGLDANIQDVNGSGFSVKDGIGNIFILAQTQEISGAGTNTFLFRAKNLGRVIALPNTITIPETIVAGVTAINNPGAAVQQGVDEESDADLKTRRRISLGLTGTGQVYNIESALRALDGVTDVWVEENDTAVTVGDVPPHSIWAIVEGGADADIGWTIYARRGAGCGTYGSVSVTVIRENGRPAVFYFDRPVEVPLYVKFDAGVLGGGQVNVDALKSFIVSTIRYTLKQIATANDFTDAVKKFSSAYYSENMLISTDNTNWHQILSPATPQQKYTLSTDNIEVDLL